jgi:predicted Zn-dependent protease
MLDLLETDDELAVFLGHEIAHVLLDHASDNVAASAISKTVELSLISLITTFGTWPFRVTASLTGLRYTAEQLKSQKNEWEADELGLKLAVDASFDSRRGINFLKRLHQHEVSTVLSIESGADRSKAVWFR